LHPLDLPPVGSPGLIALTANEVRHLFTNLLDRARHDATTAVT